MNRDVCEHFTPVDLPCEKCKSASVQKSTQPEALRLANLLDNQVTPEGIEHEAAAKLRRLHEEVHEQCRLNGMGAEREARLMTINQELLRALKNIDKEFSKHGRKHWPEAVKARAAIAKAKEKA